MKSFRKEFVLPVKTAKQVKNIASLFFMNIIIKVLPFSQKGKLCKEKYLWYFSLNINSSGIKCTHGDEYLNINFSCYYSCTKLFTNKT